MKPNYMLRMSGGGLSKPCTFTEIRSFLDFFTNPPEEYKWIRERLKFAYEFNEPDANGEVYVDLEVAVIGRAATKS